MNFWFPYLVIEIYISHKKNIVEGENEIILWGNIY